MGRGGHRAGHRGQADTGPVRGVSGPRGVARARGGGRAEWWNPWLRQAVRATGAFLSGDGGLASRPAVRLAPLLDRDDLRDEPGGPYGGDGEPVAERGGRAAAAHHGPGGVVDRRAVPVAVLGLAVAVRAALRGDRPVAVARAPPRGRWSVRSRGRTTGCGACRCWCCWRSGPAPCGGGGGAGLRVERAVVGAARPGSRTAGTAPDAGADAAVGALTRCWAPACWRLSLRGGGGAAPEARTGRTRMRAVLGPSGACRTQSRAGLRRSRRSRTS